MSFLDGKPRVATEETIKMPWCGNKQGKYFRCGLCGHRFKVGDVWRCQFTNDTPGAGGNPFICESCDGTKEEIVAKLIALREEFDSDKFWRCREAEQARRGCDNCD